MRKRKTAPKRPPRPPRLTNVADIKGPPRSGTLIHFTAGQWKQATARLKFKEVKRLPKGVVALALHPFADGGVAIEPRCEQPSGICKPVYSHHKLHDGQRLEIGCDCDFGGRPAPPPGCQTALRIVWQPGQPLPRLRLTCENTGFCKTKCEWRLVAHKLPNGPWIPLIACACSPSPVGNIQPPR